MSGDPAPPVGATSGSRPADGQPASAGLVVVDKPAGMTSHDVVARMRRLARTRKVGHAGTLDPMATGVLLLGLGKATRLLGHLALSDKTYDATVRLGAATTTDDAEGEIASTAPAGHLGEDAVRRALERFRGEIDQVPSAVSAVKIDGQRAYKRVRSGEAVELPARRVTVHELQLHGVEQVGPFLDVRLTVRCSSGTYVRALARDLGAVLAAGGHLTALRRTSVGGVTLAEATPLAELEARGHVPVLTMADTARRFFPTVTVDAAGARDVGYGRAVRLQVDHRGPVAVLDPAGELLALYEAAGAGMRPLAVFV